MGFLVGFSNARIEVRLIACSLTLLFTQEESRSEVFQEATFEKSWDENAVEALKEPEFDGFALQKLWVEDDCKITQQ